MPLFTRLQRSYSAPICFFLAALIVGIWHASAAAPDLLLKVGFSAR